jgi:Histidine kinase-, DNA gyrase B-, and HSP90-like ATPase
LVVTKVRLRLVIVALALICRGSCRGVIEVMLDLLGVSISVRTVHQVLQSAARTPAVIKFMPPPRCESTPLTLGSMCSVYFPSDPKPSGIGMGLSICRSIIEAHGGRVWTMANEPQGATFEFTLPYRPRRDSVPVALDLSPCFAAKGQ